MNYTKEEAKEAMNKLIDKLYSGKSRKLFVFWNAGEPIEYLIEFIDEPVTVNEANDDVVTHWETGKAL